MDKDELKQLRRDLGLTQADFGEWLAKQVNQTQDASLRPLSPYTRQRVSAWEAGDVVIPAKVEIVVMKRQLQQKDELIQKLRQRRKQQQ